MRHVQSDFFKGNWAFATTWKDNLWGSPLVINTSKYKGFEALKKHLEFGCINELYPKYLGLKGSKSNKAFYQFEILMGFGCFQK